MQYHVARNGQQLGVFSEDVVRQKLQAGEFQAMDLCWTESMSEWQPLSSRFLHHHPASLAPSANPYAPPSASVSIGSLQAAAQTASLATLGQRFAAAMLDSLVAMVCAIPIAFSGFFLSEAEQRGAEPSMIAFVLMGVGILLLLGLMIFNIVLLTTKGQTIGKKMMKIRIANYKDNANPGFVNCVLLRIVVNAILGSIPLLGMFYSIVDICFIFREDRRCIHDLLADTHVVQESPSA